MKKNYFLLLLLAFFSVNFINAQFTCPTSIKQQSTVATLQFKITAGTCAEFIDTTIFVSESSLSATYVYASCNGTTLKYDFDFLVISSLK